MTLLKNNGSISKKVIKIRNLETGDGWRFGVGFGLAMAIAVPVILLFLGCIIGTGIILLGGSLGALIGG